MLRTIFWTMIFFLGASMVAIQPACQKFGDKPMRRFKPSTPMIDWSTAERP